MTKKTEETAEKPYKCNICGNSFKSRNGLKGHIYLVHTEKGRKQIEKARKALREKQRKRKEEKKQIDQTTLSQESQLKPKREEEEFMSEPLSPKVTPITSEAVEQALQRHEERKITQERLGQIETLTQELQSIKERIATTDQLKDLEGKLATVQSKVDSICSTDPNSPLCKIVTQSVEQVMKTIKQKAEEKTKTTEEPPKEALKSQDKSIRGHETARDWLTCPTCKDSFYETIKTPEMMKQIFTSEEDTKKLVDFLKEKGYTLSKGESNEEKGENAQIKSEKGEQRSTAEEATRNAGTSETKAATGTTTIIGSGTISGTGDIFI